MARASSEQKAQVLADIRAKKTVTETAKANGLSRSAVYRILDGEKRAAATAAATAYAHTPYTRGLRQPFIFQIALSNTQPASLLLPPLSFSSEGLRQPVH